MGESLVHYEQPEQIQPDPTLAKEQKAYEKKLKQYEKDKARWEYFQANKERILKNQQAVEEHNEFEKKRYESRGKPGIGYDPDQLKGAFGFITAPHVLSFMEEKVIELKLNWTDGKEIPEYSSKYLPTMQRSIGHNIQIQMSDKKHNLIPIYMGSYICSVVGDGGEGLIEHSIFSFPPLPKKPTSPEAPKAKVAVKQELTELKKELVPNSLSKEEKAYEKKLKAYEKNLERYEYFLNNKERILNNKRITDENNASRVKDYLQTPGTGIYATGYNQWTVDHKLGMIEKEKVLSTIAEYTATNPFTDETKALINSQKYALENFNSGVKLNPSDKKYGFLPTYIGSWITVFLDDESKHQVYEWRMFNSFDIPKKPTPPEKPQIKESLADLKKEVLTSKEMNISRRTYGDTFPTQLEVISNGKTITLDKETYDLYVSYKATRNDRPHDLDLSFPHFKEVYLDKHPQFLRKEQKEK